MNKLAVPEESTETDPCIKISKADLNENQALLFAYENLDPEYRNERHIQYIKDQNAELYKEIDEFKENKTCCLSCDCTVEYSEQITKPIVDIYKDIVRLTKESAFDHITSTDVCIKFCLVNETYKPLVRARYSTKDTKLDILCSSKTEDFHILINNQEVPTEYTFTQFITLLEKTTRKSIFQETGLNNKILASDTIATFLNVTPKEWKAHKRKYGVTPDNVPKAHPECQKVNRTWGYSKDDVVEWASVHNYLGFADKYRYWYCRKLIEIVKQ